LIQSPLLEKEGKKDLLLKADKEKINRWISDLRLHAQDFERNPSGKRWRVNEIPSQIGYYLNLLNTATKVNPRFCPVRNNM